METDINYPSLVVAAIGVLPAMVVLVRWMFKFQRDFFEIYRAENKVLRDRVGACETEMESKDDEIFALKEEVGRLRNQVDDHERTIQRLSRALDRYRGGGESAGQNH